MSYFEPYSKALYSTKRSTLFIPGSGWASLNRLIPIQEFTNDLVTFYLTAEDWRATYLVAAYFDYQIDSPSLLRELAIAMLGRFEPIAILYTDGTYLLGTD